MTLAAGIFNFITSDGFFCSSFLTLKKVLKMDGKTTKSLKVNVHSITKTIMLSTNGDQQTTKPDSSFPRVKTAKGSLFFS